MSDEKKRPEESWKAYRPRRWAPAGTPESDPEFIGAFRVPRIPDPDEQRRYHEAHADEIKASLVELRAKWAAERDQFIEELEQAEALRKAKLAE